MADWLNTPLGQHPATLPSLYLLSQLLLFIIYINQDRLYDYLVKEELKFFVIIILQCHSFITALNYIIQWVSMWTLWDYYTSDDWLLMFVISIASILGVIVLTGNSLDLVCSPFLMSYDSVEYNVRIETPFLFEKTSRFLSHTVNYLFYELLISILSIMSWRGSYKLLDIFLYPTDENISAIISLIVGYLLFFIIMYTQYFQNISCLLSTFMYLNYPSFMTNFRHLCAFISCVFLWRGYWILFDAHIATISFIKESSYTSYIIAIILSFIILSMMKTGSSINGPMTYIHDEHNLFPLYSNCFLVKWFDQKKKSDKLSPSPSKITIIDPFTITSF